MLMLASNAAIIVDRKLEHRHSVFAKAKKHGKRGLDGLGYGLQGYQEHVYGPVSAPPPPVYEIPAPDAGYPVPEPLPPVVGHPVGE